MTKKSTKERIVEVLRIAGKPLAVHEFRFVAVGDQHGQEFIGRSENSISARLRELARETPPKVKGADREGQSFKEWSLVEAPVPAVPA